MNSRQRIFNTFNGQKIDHLGNMPITMMFASDLIGRKYYDYVTDYRVLVEGQLKVAEKFQIDHVSCISDPAREAHDCGAPVMFHPDAPAAIDESKALLADKTKLASLKIPNPLGGGRMHDRIKAAELFKQKVGDDKVIEGWIEGPCAEGADLRGINTIMMDFFEDTAFIKDLFEFTLQMGLEFAKYQVQAGANLMGVGDAAASLLGPQIYKDFVLPYEKRLVEGIHKMGCAVRLHICGNITDLLSDIAKLNCEIVDVDYPVDIRTAREKMPNQVIIGNLNPVACLRDSSPERIFAEIETCHRVCGSRFIVGAGCEVPRDTSYKNLNILTDYALSH